VIDISHNPRVSQLLGRIEEVRRVVAKLERTASERQEFEREVDGWYLEIGRYVHWLLRQEPEALARVEAESRRWAAELDSRISQGKMAGKPRAGGSDDDESWSVDSVIGDAPSVDDASLVELASDSAEAAIDRRELNEATRSVSVSKVIGDVEELEEIGASHMEALPEEELDGDALEAIEIDDLEPVPTQPTGERAPGRPSGPTMAPREAPVSASTPAGSQFKTSAARRSAESGAPVPEVPLVRAPEPSKASPAPSPPPPPPPPAPVSPVTSPVVPNPPAQDATPKAVPQGRDSGPAAPAPKATTGPSAGKPSAAPPPVKPVASSSPPPVRAGTTAPAATPAGTPPRPAPTASSPPPAQGVSALDLADEAGEAGPQVEPLDLKPTLTDIDGEGLTDSVVPAATTPVDHAWLGALRDLTAVVGAPEKGTLGEADCLAAANRLLNATTNMNVRWMGFPDGVQQALVGCIACRARNLQLRMAVDVEVRLTLGRLRRFHKARKLPTLTALDEDGRPEGRSWEADAHRWWSQLKEGG
jgi:hypothetical protein